MKQAIKQEAKIKPVDKLHQAIVRNEFITVALSAMAELNEEEYSTDIWFGCYLIMDGINNDLKEALEELVEKDKK